MSAITKSAAGKPCLLRIPNVCRQPRGTTVHNHLRRAQAAGVGQKPPDIIGIRGCMDCHDWLDARRHDGLYAELRDRYELEGLVRTLRALVDEGIVT